MKKNIIAAAVAALVLPAAAIAAEPNMSYTYGEIGYTDLDQDGFSADGLALEGSYEFMQQVFGFASYQDLSGDFDSSTFIVGAGYVMPFNDKVDGYAKLGFVSDETGPFDDTGFMLGFGLRADITKQVEGFFEYTSTDIYDDTSSAFELGGRYWFQENMGVSLAYNDVEDADGFTVAFRYNF